MGNLRFTLGAIQQILQGKTHQAHIAVLPLAKADTILQDAAADEPEGGALHTYITFLFFRTQQGSQQTITVRILRMSNLNDTVHSTLF